MINFLLSISINSMDQGSSLNWPEIFLGFANLIVAISIGYFAHRMSKGEMKYQEKINKSDDLRMLYEVFFKEIMLVSCPKIIKNQLVSLNKLDDVSVKDGIKWCKSLTNQVNHLGIITGVDREGIEDRISDMTDVFYDMLIYLHRETGVDVEENLTEDEIILKFTESLETLYRTVNSVFDYFN